MAKAMEESSGSVLQFATNQSFVDEGFWHKLASLKLNVLRIDDSPLRIHGFCAPCAHSQVSNHVSLLSESLPSGEEEESFTTKGNRNKCPVPGTLYNMNTMEAFRALDKKKLIKLEAQKIWDDIRSGKAVQDCSVLSRFLVVSYADLKKWTFHYWCAFPAMVLDPPAVLIKMKPAAEWFSVKEAESVSSACNSWRNSISTTGVPFFLVIIGSDSRATLLNLADWETCQKDGQKVLFGFYDPCHLPSVPGWPLRNFLTFISLKFNLREIPFLCYRETRGFADLGFSLVGEAAVTISQEWINQPSVGNVVGWELNKGKYAPRFINLAESMDSTRLAVSAADLNLKLMRWRAMPMLNLEKLSSMKCLLLGAGTLGCQVARMLMAWGVRKITLLDSGRVAMSNPLRQSLYTIDDCLNGGEYKAVAAVQSLKKIFPAVEAEGIVMAIPMPGHPITNQEEETVINDCNRLQYLVESHDAVFLLTDTRESRWLPTLFCADCNKITITAALGFDSFLVMRHGPGPLSSSHDSESQATDALSHDTNSLTLAERKQRLGCYFCSDVVAPTDSTTNRTLDQQCTVTRPGLAPMASALAVELFVNMLHHPQGIYATHSIQSNGEGDVALPHQIRGSLHQFSQMALMGYSSVCCTACCSTVVAEYQQRGMEFVLQVMNHPTYLEDLTGLTELKTSANSFEVDWDEDVDDDKTCL